MSSANRRTFLATSLSATAALTVSPIFAAEKKLVVGIMGTGGRGTALAKTFASQANISVAVITDADETNANKAAAALVKAGQPKPQIVSDFRKILDDKSVDILVCAAPNHWHAPASILACNAGKHVYVEKPCSHTPWEGERLVAAARRNKSIVQMGSQRRSMPTLMEGIQKLHDGVIGKVYYGQAWYTNDRQTIGKGKAEEPPAGLDYELWQGPAPRLSFKTNYLHYNWHWFWQWGNGELGNNGIHHIDVLRWGLGVTYPNKVTSAAGKYMFDDDQQTPDTHIASYEFPGGKTITWEGFSRNRLPHAKNVECMFVGEKGTMTTNNGSYTLYDSKGTQTSHVPGPAGDITHVQNFLAAVRGEAKLNAEIAEGANSTLLCHLGNIAHRVGRILKCDTDDGKIINDPDAMKLWTKPYAAEWEAKLA